MKARRMRRTLLFLSIFGLVFALPGSAALADHPAPALGVTNAPSGSTANSGGEGAEWELVTSLVSGNPHTDIDFFTQDGITYVSAGTLAIGGNGGGQTIHKLMDADGTVAPEFVSHHPSASCISDPGAALGLQHDVEATPKGGAILNTDWGGRADTSDAQLLIDSTDAPTRCHDQGETGLELLGLLSPPQGGLEIIDITDIDNPVEIALTSHIGEAHTVNVDPKRPHIAYAVSSDAVSFSDNQRTNEDPDGDPMDLDGFEVVDLSSCMDFPADATVDQKRGVDEAGEFLDGQGCRPEVYRYRWPTPVVTLGHTDQSTVYGCHELEIYPNDLLSCGGGGGAALFDMSGAFDDNGTPDDFTDDVPNGDPLPCRVRQSTSSPLTTTGAPIIDCVVGEDEQDLTIPGWIELGEPSLEGVEHLGTAHHMGRGGPFPAPEDIDFNHETELTASQDFLLATDERGGGVTPPDASCSPGVPNEDGNGGIHAYAVDRLDTSQPPEPVDENGDPVAEGEAYDPYARTPDGEKAIFRFEPKVPAASFCTAHVFQQVPGQNRIFMGWYTQGTVVLDFIEHPDGTFEWQEAGYFIPENANTWVSHVFKVEENDDGTFTYWGATGDFQVATGAGPGRNAVDVYKVTLPAPPQFEGQDEPAPAPDEGAEPAPDQQDTTTPVTGGGLALVALTVLGLGATLARRRR